MSRLFFLISILVLSVSAQAGMSDIDLEVREAISYELDENPDDIHSMRFVDNQPGCLFVVEAQVFNNSCKVCFEGTFESHYAAETICERLWLQSEQEL
jgi:hypothetical protein